MGPHQVLLGNIDPVRVLRNGTSKDVYAAVANATNKLETDSS